jgi:4-hydroxy-tetrahydrodipicolinate synthase
MLPKTVVRLANDFQNIVAAKEAAGDMVQAMQIVKNKPRFSCDFRDDMIALPMVLAGGAGVISIKGFPRSFLK